MYDDVSGVLTALLISKGHLSSSQWAGQMPRYYIEIKSTLNSCETPFYVSPGQAERVSEAPKKATKETPGRCF